MLISEIQLAVYYQCYVIIGWAQLDYMGECYGPLVVNSVGFENQTMAAESRFVS